MNREGGAAPQGGAGLGGGARQPRMNREGGAARQGGMGGMGGMGMRQGARRGAAGTTPAATARPGSGANAQYNSGESNIRPFDDEDLFVED